MAQVIDIYLIYQFLRRLVTPFDSWDAYKTGVIDKDGTVLVDKKDRSAAQRNSWGYYDVLLANLKKLLGKIPGGKTRIASFAAALLLLREGEEGQLDPDNIEYLEERINFYMTEASILMEDAPVNVAGSGNIAGLGVGPAGEPGIDPKKKSRNAILSDILRRRRDKK